MQFWRSQAFICHLVNGVEFPSKEGDAAQCDDGDMTLFNGLLCAAGEQLSCEAVKNAQGDDGRWWRSPRRIGMEWPASDVSFSPDQGRGVLLYVLTRGDREAFDRWLNWIDAHRPCIIELGHNCLVKGWPRLCTDDAPDKRCTFRPGTCAVYELVRRHFLSASDTGCREVLEALGMDLDGLVKLTELQSSLSALVNDKGYPMHLAAIEIWLLRKLGIDGLDTSAAEKVLLSREPGNAFFAYLAGESPDKVTELVLDHCPSPTSPSKRRFQWTWEREMAEKAWQNSMYWDCIFMGLLLGAS